MIFRAARLAADPRRSLRIEIGFEHADDGDPVADGDARNRVGDGRRDVQIDAQRHPDVEQQKLPGDLPHFAHGAMDRSIHAPERYRLGGIGRLDRSAPLQPKLDLQAPAGSVASQPRASGSST